MEGLGISKIGNRTQLLVENIKCDGCGRTISNALGEIGLKNVAVDAGQSSVEVDTPADGALIVSAVKRLKELGYPLIDTESGLKAVALKAKSYISCAIGKMS